jgi:hypothetical protein
MIRGVAYSRPFAAAATAALIAAGAMFWIRLATHAKLSELRLHAANSERDLATRIGALSAYESDNVDALRRQVGLFRVRLGTDGTWDRLVRRLGGGWSAESGLREDKSGYSLQPGTFRLLSHAVGEWPDIVEAVKDLEAIPGVGIAEIEMKTSGSGDRRSLDTARILVLIQASRTGPNSATTP